MKYDRQIIVPFFVLWTIVGMFLFGNAKADQIITDQDLQFGQYLINNLTGNNWIIRTVYLPDHSAKQNEVMQYAYTISNSKDFLYTLYAENGTIDPQRRSMIIGKNGYYDYGLCQLNYQWHSAFIDSPDFDDWKKQVDYCWRVYQQRPTAFYGYYKRYNQSRHFVFN